MANFRPLCPHVIVARIGNYIFGDLHDFGQIRGSAKQPEMDQFVKFYNLFLYKMEIGRDLLYAKNANLCIWAPQCRPFWTNGGVCLLAQNGSIFNNFMINVELCKKHVKMVQNGKKCLKMPNNQQYLILFEF